MSTSPGLRPPSPRRIESRKTAPVRTACTVAMIRLHDAPSARCDRHTTIARTLQMSQVPRWGRVMPRTVSRTYGIVSAMRLADKASRAEQRPLRLRRHAVILGLITATAPNASECVSAEAACEMAHKRLRGNVMARGRMWSPVTRPCGWCRVASLPGGVLWHLADDIGGVLVVPQALEPGVAQFPVGRPFAEAHLGDQAWLDPVHTGPRQPAAVERGMVLLQRGQRRMQAVQRSLAESGADLAGVDELVTGVVVAQQQRPEPGAGTLRVGEAADDKFLAALALELQPVRLRPAW